MKRYCPKCNTTLSPENRCLFCKITYKYFHRDVYLYYSRRYNRFVTVPDGYPSDGATGVKDIDSESWWVHDVLCDRGTWDDGILVTNWQASWVIADILYKESRRMFAADKAWRGLKRVSRSWLWLAGTFLWGGGECRKNGMFRLKEDK